MVFTHIQPTQFRLIRDQSVSPNYSLTRLRRLISGFSFFCFFFFSLRSSNSSTNFTLHLLTLLHVVYNIFYHPLSFLNLSFSTQYIACIIMVFSCSFILFLMYEFCANLTAYAMETLIMVTALSILSFFQCCHRLQALKRISEPVYDGSSLN